MGVKGLRTFAEGKKFRWNATELPRGSKLVIDGNNVACELYRTCHWNEWRHGGSYPEFYTTVKAFFIDLQQRGIEVFVLFDGIDCDDRQFDAMRQQREKKSRKIQSCQTSGRYSGHVIPLFTETVCVDVLRDLKRNFCFANGVADPIIVALANSLECPVLAADSDYFLYGLEHGFLEYNLSVAKGMLKYTPPLYCVSVLADRCARRDPDLRFLIPAILGSKKLDPFRYDNLTTVEDVMNFAARLESVQKIPEIDDSLFAKFEEARTVYSVEPLRGGFQEVMAAPGVSVDIPGWVLERYRIGKFEKRMVDIFVTKKWLCPNVIDKVDAPSAVIISHDIQKSICGILTGRTDRIKYMRRCNTPLSYDEDSLTPNVPPFMLCNIPDMNQETKQRQCLEILHMHDRTQPLLDSLPPEWRLPAISAAYWCKNAQNPRIQQRLAKALILCFLTCSQTGECSYPVLQPHTLDLDVLHAFAQWQCVYDGVIALNQLLCEPFQYVSPARLFSGELAHHYTTLPDHSLQRTPLYKLLFRSVLLSCQSSEAPIAAQQPRLPAVAGANPFGILSEEMA